MNQGHFRNVRDGVCYGVGAEALIQVSAFYEDYTTQAYWVVTFSAALLGVVVYLLQETGRREREK